MRAMRPRRAIAVAVGVSALAAGALATPGAGGGDSAGARTSAAGELELSIARPGKGGYEARARFDAETEVRVRIEMRLVGRAITGGRETIDSEAVEKDLGPGKVRLAAPFAGATAACFGFERCELRAMATASQLSPPVPPATEPTVGEAEDSASAERRVATGRPDIEKRHIPFGKNRRRQMAAYSERHYGEREWRLEGPRGIVEHYTASSTAGPALNTFIANRPDVEYGELPGVCAHYLIDRDGTIMELVPTDTRCRHTVGLNHETVGIEHVGQSDSDVVGRPDVLRASLALTDWLRCAYEIKRSNVIGHNESLDSPLYEEHDPDFRGRTHGDMRPGTMNGYRRELAEC